MSSLGTISLPHWPLIFDRVPYTDPVSHMCRPSVLGAHPPMTYFPLAPFADYSGRSIGTPLMTSASGEGALH